MLFTAVSLLNLTFYQTNNKTRKMNRVNIKTLSKGFSLATKAIPKRNYGCLRPLYNVRISSPFDFDVIQSNLKFKGKNRINVNKDNMNGLELNSDFIEFDDKYEVIMNVPGLKKEDLKIKIDGGNNLYTYNKYVQLDFHVRNLFQILTCVAMYKYKCYIIL